MQKIMIVMIVLVFSSIAFSQDKEPEQPEPKTAEGVIVDLPILSSSENRAPKITLQQALKNAEQYIKKNKIDTSDYYLASITSFMYGSEDQVKVPMWQVSWVRKKSFAIGDYITIIVSMEDGSVGRLPSM